MIGWYSDHHCTWNQPPKVLTIAFDFTQEVLPFVVTWNLATLSVQFSLISYWVGTKDSLRKLFCYTQLICDLSKFVQDASWHVSIIKILWFFESILLTTFSFDLFFPIFKKQRWFPLLLLFLITFLNLGSDSPTLLSYYLMCTFPK